MNLAAQPSSADYDSLDQVMLPSLQRPGSVHWTVPEGWQQGRGAFGGLVLGAMVRALQLHEPDAARSLRSLTAELAGPVLPGLAEIEVEVLRRGNALTLLRATLRQAGEAQVSAVGVFAAPRPDTPEWNLGAPLQAPDWREIEPAFMPPGIAPVFAKHFEYRVVGPAPFSGASRPEASGWVRARGAARPDVATLVAHVDAWWLAAMATFDRPRPAATVSFTLEVVGDLEGLDPQTPLFHRATSTSARQGYVNETRELFAADGRLLAINHQLVAIIK